jgi:oxaloacetate decarboxylase gamma subunit
MDDSTVSIISQGVDLMLYGMGTVFAFLLIMVFVLLLLARVVKAFPGPAQLETTAAISSSNSVDPAHRKAIEQAIKLHHKK